MTSKTYLSIIVLALLSGLTTFIGVWLASFLKRSKIAIVGGLSFSAGIMVLISLFELIPESIKKAGISESALGIFSGILLIAILDFILPHIHLKRESRKVDFGIVKVAYLCAIGLIIHDFPEGFAMANSYLHSPYLGLLVALAIAIHNIPEEFAIAVPLILAKDRLIYRIAFVSALAEPAGAIIALFLVNLVPVLTSFFMSLAAGAMLFVATHELIPVARTYKRNGPFWLGIAASVVVYLMLVLIIPG